MLPQALDEQAAHGSRRGGQRLVVGAGVLLLLLKGRCSRNSGEDGKASQQDQGLEWREDVHANRNTYMLNKLHDGVAPRRSGVGGGGDEQSMGQSVRALCTERICPLTLPHQLHNTRVPTGEAWSVWLFCVVCAPPSPGPSPGPRCLARVSYNTLDTCTGPYVP